MKLFETPTRDTFLDRIMQYEDGDLTFEETVDLFADLVRSGQASQSRRSIPRTRFHLTTQGGHVGSRRHRTFASLTEAQEAAIKWAARRFYVEVAV